MKTYTTAYRLLVNLHYMFNKLDGKMVVGGPQNIDSIEVLVTEQVFKRSVAEGPRAGEIFVYDATRAKMRRPELGGTILNGIAEIDPSIWEKLDADVTALILDSVLEEQPIHSDSPVRRHKK